jgi:adenosylcobinamide-GDP ribazoletransferase
LVSRLHPIKDAGLALSLLTAIPTPATITEDSRPQVAAWFPAVGAIFGFVGWGIVHGVERLHSGTRTSFLIAALIVLAWALLSRFLHWDGLADVADGFWGSHDRERRLEIMSDSRTGAFGATAVALVALIEVTAIGAIIARPHELVVLLVPVISRFSATAGAWLGAPARPGGLGRSVIGHPNALSVLIALVPLAGVATGMWGGYDMPGLILAACGVIVALAVPHVLSSRFGGVTGDVLGASVLITETALFVAFALVVT